MPVGYSLSSNSDTFDMSHSGVTVIEFRGSECVIPKVLQLSNDSHLFASGISTDYCNRIHFLDEV